MVFTYEQAADIAKVCHEANRAYCQTLGDDSQAPWSEAPDWQVESAINGVLYHAEHPDSKPSDSHENWLKQKQDEGWQYGPIKNPETKEHPCFVPYDELPAEAKRKDYIFTAIVRAMLVPLS